MGEDRGLSVGAEGREVSVSDTHRTALIFENACHIAAVFHGHI